MTDRQTWSVPWKDLRLIFLFCLFLYFFILSIQLLGVSFKLFGKGFADNLIRTTSSPFTGLFIGILATSLTQSSSTTTSIVVGLVASGVLSLHNAIPIVMGANIGTTITSIIVSLGHINRKLEFQRAFAASLVHDNFNLLSVMILFPLNLWTNYLERMSTYVSGLVKSSGGMTFGSPLKMVTAPVASAIAELFHNNGLITLIFAMFFLFLSLRYMVVYMKALIMDRAGTAFDQIFFKTPYHALFFGMMLTALIQSSSVTTSLMIPLAGAGLITLEKLAPYTMGTNVGTTITAFLAAFATGNPVAVSVAVAHLFFNVSGLALFWWVRWIPIKTAEWIARLTTINRIYAVIYVLLLFFLIPLSLVFFMN
ncbi:MAG: Na/Pi symporter [Chloroflexi bacterium]|jgi:solute carrier family 34 (sodium-dependent phosphate cotransporter)|nr:Na/Pi symporter [Chloroflexota bacterium]